jgi:hypothetical protein
MADFTQEQLKSALVDALRQYGAAADATLVNLSKGIQKSGANTGGSTSGGGATADPGKVMRDQAASIDKGLKTAGDVLSNSGSMVADAFANTTPTIGAFSSKFAGAGGIVGAFSGVLDNNVQIFRTLSQSGLDLGNSLFSAQLAAAEAKIPLDVFAGVVRQNSGIMSAFGGTATDGTVKFAKMTGKVMDDFGGKLGLLGFSMEEITTYNASYTEQMTRSGMAQRMTTAQLAEGAGKYNLELDRLAKATGVSRQQLDEANKAQQRDVRMRLAMQNLSTEERTAINAKMEQLKQLDPSGKLAAGFQDLIAGGGVALTQEAKTLTIAMNQAGVDIQSITRGASNGVAGSAAAIEGSIAKLGKSSENMNAQSVKTTTALATMGTYTPGYFAAAAAGLKESEGALAKGKEEQNKAEAEALKKGGTKTAATFDQTLTQVQNSLKKSMIDSNIFPKTAEGFQSLINIADEGVKQFSNKTTERKIELILGASAIKSIVDAVRANAGEILTALGAAGGAAYGANKGTTPSGPAAPPAPDDVADKSTKGRVKESVSKVKGNIFKVLAGGVAYLYWDEIVEFTKPALDKVLKYKPGEGPEPAKPNTETPTPAPAPGTEISQSAVNARVANFEPIKVELDGTSVEKVNQNVKNISESLKQIDFSKLMVPANISTSIETSNNKLKELNETLKNTTSSFNDLNNANLTKLTDTITKLNESVAKMSNQPGADSKTASGTKVSAKTSEDILSELGVKLDQLNSTMASVASSQSDAVDYLSKTAKNTRQSVGNMLG